MSSSSYRCIVAQYKTGTVFLRKTCSERYALMSPLNEFIGQVHENRASVQARYNGYHTTYGSTLVISSNDKNAIPHIALRTQNTTKKFPLERFFFLYFHVAILFWSKRNFLAFVISMLITIINSITGKLQYVTHNIQMIQLPIHDACL